MKITNNYAPRRTAMTTQKHRIGVKSYIGGGISSVSHDDYSSLEELKAKLKEMGISAVCRVSSSTFADMDSVGKCIKIEDLNVDDFCWASETIQGEYRHLRQDIYIS